MEVQVPLGELQQSLQGTHEILRICDSVFRWAITIHSYKDGITVAGKTCELPWIVDFLMSWWPPNQQRGVK